MRSFNTSYSKGVGGDSRAGFNNCAFISFIVKQTIKPLVSDNLRFFILSARGVRPRPIRLWRRSALEGE